MTPGEAEQLLPVLVYIQAHLEERLSLEELALQAKLSPRHLHRLFQNAFGETPKHYVQRLRLERAAFSLHFQLDSILDVAISVGYESHEVFTRAFQRHYGMSPSKYREGLLPVDTAPPERCMEASSPRSYLSKVKIIDMISQYTAFIRSVGSYENIDPDLWSSVASWLKQRSLPSSGALIGIGHDAPGITPSEKLRFDACITVNQPFKGEGHIACQRLVGGPHAVITHVGPLSDLPQAYAELPNRLERIAGYQPIWLPIVEVYHANTVDGINTVLHTDICVPIRPIVD